MTSQFGQQARILNDLPLGDCYQARPAALVNLVGAPGFAGSTEVEGLSQALAIDGVSLHLYGKTECRPGRKMGHFSVVADTVDQVLNKAAQAKSLIQIRGSEML